MGFVWKYPTSNDVAEYVYESRSWPRMVEIDLRIGLEPMPEDWVEVPYEVCEVGDRVRSTEGLGTVSDELDSAWACVFVSLDEPVVLSGYSICQALCCIDELELIEKRGVK